MTNNIRTCTCCCLLLFFTACQAQKKTPENSTPVSAADKNIIVGGGCDGCELMFADMPQQIDAVDTSVGWFANTQRLLVSGKVFEPDGQTPSPGVIIYYWQTDHTGYYTPGKNQPAATRRHGQLRGWVKTDAEGRYAIYTCRPAPYPTLTDPAHIHFSIKEPGIANEYYIDDVVFTDDSQVNTAYRNSRTNRGGDGIVELKKQKGLQLAERNIILGMNVNDYPDRKK